MNIFEGPLPAYQASLITLVVKNPSGNAGNMRQGFSPWASKILWRRAWQTALVIFPGVSHERRSLAGTVHTTAKCQTWPKWLSTHTNSAYHPSKWLGKKYFWNLLMKCKCSLQPMALPILVRGDDSFRISPWAPYSWEMLCPWQKIQTDPFSCAQVCQNA